MNPADYPRTYRMAPWGRALIIVLGSTLVVVGAGLVFLTSNDASRSQVSDSLLILSAALALPGLLIVISIWRSKLVLSADAIEVHGIFGVSRLARADIAGRRLVRLRYGQTQTQLVPRGEGMKTLRLSPSSLKTDALYDRWIASLPDLDALEVKAAEAQVAADPELGQSPEERLARVAGARKSANAFNVVVSCLAAWGYLYPRPYAPALLTLAIMPWVAVWVVARSNGLYRVLARRNEIRPSLAWPIFMPGFLLLIRALQDVGVLDLARALSFATGVAALLAGAAFMSDPRLHKERASAVLWMLFLLAYGYGTVVLGNRLLDRSPGEAYRVEVLGKRMSHGSRSTSYYLLLAPWGPRPKPREVSVPGSLYTDMQRGGSVCIQQGPGALGIGWYVIGRCW